MFVVLVRRFEGGFDKIWLRKIKVDSSRRIDEERIECFLGLLDGVFNGIWEVFDGIRGNRFFRRVLGR